MSFPIKPTTAADITALTKVQSQDPSQEITRLKETAKQFESLFTKMVLKSMRDANKGFGESLFGSSQQDMYQDMFDGQLSQQLAGGRGLGLADLLVQQLARSGLVQTPGQAPAQISTQTSTQPSTQPFSQAISRQSGTAVAVNPAIKQAASGPSGTKEDFVRSMLPLARQAGSALGVDPHALVAQAALETGWGKSVPATSNGSSSFNLFGIKAGSSWSGASVKVPTLEFDAGTAVRKVESFRSYDSAAASFNDFAGLIGNSPRYADAIGKGGDVAAFASALQQGGYATDPDYAKKVAAVASEVRSVASGGGGSLKSEQARPLQRMERKT